MSRSRSACSFFRSLLTPSTTSVSSRSSISPMTGGGYYMLRADSRRSLWTGWMRGPARHGSHALLRRQPLGDTHDLPVDEPRVLPGPHHFALGEIFRALGPQRPEYAGGLHARHERRQPTEIVAVAKDCEDHVGLRRPGR